LEYPIIEATREKALGGERDYVSKGARVVITRREV
jgi:hypothetical protein